VFLKHKAEMPARRGSGWVALQFAVMALAAGAGFVPPRWPHAAHGALSTAGIALIAGGALVAVWSAWLLGPAFTPFPRPREEGELVERGPYRLVRHPIYSAGLLFFVGYSLCASVPALVVTGALAVVWGLKARVEERLLATRYPAYEAYTSRVRFRLVPLVY
jgi:protein-S-isoprenylcysteine O-methyltransferase Ste14